MDQTSERVGGSGTETETEAETFIRQRQNRYFTQKVSVKLKSSKMSAAFSSHTVAPISIFPLLGSRLSPDRSPRLAQATCRGSSSYGRFTFQRSCTLPYLPYLKSVPWGRTWPDWSVDILIVHHENTSTLSLIKCTNACYLWYLTLIVA